MAAARKEELERFRQQWQEEVKSRTKGQVSATSNRASSSHQSFAGAGPSATQQPPPNLQQVLQEAEDGWEYGYHDLENKNEGHKLSETNNDGQTSPNHEPASALEHYEKAVERESEGSLGDSLKHYRKAYRLDAAVDKAYKNKHFSNPPPPNLPKPTSPNPSNATVTVPNTAHHSLTDAHPSSISELLISFAALSIPPVDPPTDASPQPPCPFSTLPPELLTQTLHHLALLDPASLARTSLVCKRLAYLIATEDRIWQSICLSREHGLARMHYTWACSIAGSPLAQSISSFDLGNEHEQSPTRKNISLSPAYPSYKKMYHTRPRLRFTGCYISTVNYHRPGASTASMATWNTPVLIVTYYRYLRFHRDGSCISLLTTAEPGEVVHQLFRENLGRGFAQGAPGAVMNQAVRGRWRLSGDPFKEKRRAEEGEGGGEEIQKEQEEEEEGVVHIETEGADAATKNPKYVYKMMLALQSAGGGRGGKTRNNKMAWLGYWSYNKLSDDWAEFGLKNDKPFFWSRVKSYGDGE